MNELATRGMLAHVRAVVPAYGRPYGATRATPVTRPQPRRDTGTVSKRWQTLARAGWAAKGSLYFTLGGLALLAAVGEGGRLLGTKGVLAWVLGQPFGRALLFLAAVGLACYALWRCARAIHSPTSDDSMKERIARIGSALTGLLHAALSVAAFQMLAGGGSAGGPQTWIGRLMSVGPVGTGLVTMTGLVVIGVGLYQFKRAADLDFMEDLDADGFSLDGFRALRIVGRIGHAARGVVLPIIGYSLARAAFLHDPNQAKGTGGALAELAQTSWIILAITAVGLMAYGLLNLVFARYRRAQVHV